MPSTLFRTFREGLKTINNRRSVNFKISSLQIVKVEDISEQDRDVCSICYQDFNDGMATQFADIYWPFVYFTMYLYRINWTIADM